VLSSLLVSLFAACAWQTPLDTGAAAGLNSISGTVVVDGVADPGPTFVLLYDADDPPPPYGTGRPVNLAAISPGDFTGDGAGVQSAPFILTGVEDGQWLLSGLVDMDEDFHPALTAAAGATCGDVIGAHITDITSQELAPVTVRRGELLDDVTVAVAAPMTTERPAFVFGGSNTVSRDPTVTSVLSLTTTGIESDWVAFDYLDELATGGCPPLFLLYAVDADADGLPDPHPNASLAALGAYDVWPRIYLRWLGEDGRAIVGESLVDPTPLYADPMNPAIGVPVPTDSLGVIYVPAAVEIGEDGSETLLYYDDVPAGQWSITVVNITGQTWTLPNELAAFPASEGARDSYSPEAQGLPVVVE
jgi:hypothetical protein